jgi:hypothetical protein
MTTSQLKPERRCPLEGAHTRLHQSHELWHRLVAAYPDPDEFVLVLNQLLVTLRQVTFMVKKRKAAFENFDSWYGDWQDRLRADSIMNWLKDARNHVEKVGGLAITSTARVEIVASWLPGPVLRVRGIAANGSRGDDQRLPGRGDPSRDSEGRTPTDRASLG